MGDGDPIGQDRTGQDRVYSVLYCRQEYRTTYRTDERGLLAGQARPAQRQIGEDLASRLLHVLVLVLDTVGRILILVLILQVRVD